MQSRHTFTFLGTGAGCGVPAFFCDCPACEEAKAEPRARRGCCGVLIEGCKKMLIDTPPDIRHQFLREDISRIDRLMYTHAHFDHLGGLGELEYLVRLILKQPLETFASNEALEGIQTEFGYMFDCLDPNVLEPFDSISYDEVTYTALPVTHAPGTFGYLIETESMKLFYASDTGQLETEIKKRIADVDFLILDATFWGKNWHPHAHHSVQEAIETGLELDAKHIYLTHLAMHYDEPITLKELEEYIKQYDGRVQVALDGLKLEI